MRDLSEMIKGNYFQFLSKDKREAILGEGSQTLQDFDIDPGSMVPALSPGMPGYTKELDPLLATRDERARYMAKQFVFIVAPNSILAINAQEQKMVAFQEFRMGALDFWSFHERMETPNVGAPPAIPLPPIQMPPIQDAVGLQQLLATGKYILSPDNGQILEIRVPVTVTERLIAQNQLQIGLVANSPGRKSSGQEPPKMESKNDGRPSGSTVTESKK